MTDQLTKLQKRFAAIPREVKQAVEPALMRTAERVANRQRQLAPVDTGALRDSITVTGPGKPTPAHSQPGGTTVVPENAVMITAGNDAARHVHLVEYGTAKSPAQSFFWPGFRLERNGALRTIKRAISTAVKRAR
ncbi:MAG: phage protein gp10 family [Microvirga sp.]|jgi:HK97 gp10 family phage protein|nr:phage protein gp10 family [Microvirga sp.]